MPFCRKSDSQHGFWFYRKSIYNFFIVVYGQPYVTEIYVSVKGYSQEKPVHRIYINSQPLGAKFVSVSKFYILAIVDLFTTVQVFAHFFSPCCSTPLNCTPSNCDREYIQLQQKMRKILALRPSSKYN
jgi:hypothetical protein